MINEPRSKYQTRKLRIRSARIYVDNYRSILLRNETRPLTWSAESRRKKADTIHGGAGEHLKDAFISLPFEQNLPRGLMLRLLSFNGLLIVQHPGPEGGGEGEGLNDALDADSQRNREKWTRGEFSSTFFAKFFLSPPLRVSNEASRTRSHDSTGGREGNGCVCSGLRQVSRNSRRARPSISIRERRIPLSLSHSLSLCLGGRDRWYNGEGKGVAKWP